MAIVYKYLPPERITYLRDQLLRFTQPAALNDPYECIPSIDRVDELALIKRSVERNAAFFRTFAEVKGGRKARKWMDRHMHEQIAALHAQYKKNPEYLHRVFTDLYMKHTNNGTGIFSLSGRWDSTLMWSHYCSGHSGFCVGLDANHEFFKRQPSEPRDIDELRFVEYRPERVKMTLGKKPDVGPELFYRKSPDWEYEKEARLVRRLAKANRTLKATPWPICLFTVPHAAIREVIIGANAAPDLKAEILAKAAQLKVTAYQAVVSRTCFDLERKQAD